MYGSHGCKSAMKENAIASVTITIILLIPPSDL